MAIYLYSLMLLLMSLTPTPMATRMSPTSTWWNDLGNDWEVSNTLQQRSPQNAAYSQISRQMDYYAPASHAGRINTGGDLRNPAQYRPRDHTYWKNADFNEREFLRKSPMMEVD